MRRKTGIHRERGGAAGWIFAIIGLMVIGIGAYVGLIKLGIVEAPEALAGIPGMEAILPAPEVEEEELTDAVPVSEDASLRILYFDAMSDLATAQNRIAALQQELDEKNRAVQQREDEIVMLRGTLSLARDQNINSVALIYENMDQQEASVILSNLGADRASLILAAMRESKAADVLAEMDEQLATDITELMAGFEETAPVFPASTEPTTPPGTTGGFQPVEGSPVVPTPSG